MLSANYGTQIAYKISCRRDKRRKHVNSKSIGKTLVACSYPSTIDGYWFIVTPGTILNTFDFVTVNNFKSKTIGLVQDIRTLPSEVLNDRPVYDELAEYGEKICGISKGP